MFGGHWLPGKEKEIWAWHGFDELYDELHYSHDEPVDIHRLIEVLNKRLDESINMMKLYVKGWMPVAGTVDKPVSLTFSENTLPFLFQLRNPPRPPCIHGEECLKAGFQQVSKKLLLDLSKDFYIAICDEISENDMKCLITFFKLLDSFASDFLGSLNESVDQYALFLTCQNFLTFPLLILLDTPNNYQPGERVPAFTLEKKFYYIDAQTLVTYFNEMKPEDKIFTLINQQMKWRTVDYQGHPRMDWAKMIDEAATDLGRSIHNRLSDQLRDRIFDLDQEDLSELLALADELP